MFVRNETSNIQSKAQAFQTLMSGGLEPSLALAKSGVSNDPVAVYKLSEKWMKLRWGDPEAQAAEQAAPTEGEKGTLSVEDGGGNEGAGTQPDKGNPGSTSPNVGGDDQASARKGWVSGYYRA
jgi:hypothetical protein